MRDRPDGPTLAALARGAAARGEDRALIGRALAIAEREAAAGEKPLESCRAALVQLYGEAALLPLLRRFGDDISAGRFDAPGPAREAALRLLWAITRQKLSEANPDYLAAAEG
ncbi:MAG TPA: DUF6285 domain-containing protein [Stellaceae bacterium]|nr:DUF6285 domain-containing protein [Stellaceae bacterium]